MSDYNELVPLASISPINVGLQSATEETMISILGRPEMPLTTNDAPERASETVKRLAITANIGKFRATGIPPAIASLQSIFAQVKNAVPDLYNVVSSAGMLVVRLRRPTSGIPSTKISNHAWGTAIDLKIGGQGPVGNTGQKVPRGIGMLVPYFNAAGWYSGIAFHDDMHFEVSDGTIHHWAAQGLFDPPH